MRKKLICAALTSILAMGAFGEKIDITTLKYAGPFKVSAPVMIDSIDVNSAKFDTLSLLKTPISLKLADDGKTISEPVLPAVEGQALHLLSFTIDNERYFNGSLKIKGPKHKEIYLDGKPFSGEKLALMPATHTVTVKCLSLSGSQQDSIKIFLETDGKTPVTINSEKDRRYTLHDVITGKRINNSRISPSGKYLITLHSTTHDNGTVSWSSEVSDLASGKQLFSSPETLRWMPKSDQIYFCRYAGKKLQFITIDPATLKETIVADDIPTATFTISPTEDFFVYVKVDKGPKEKSEKVYEIAHPEDRQPGWRNRGYLMKYDLKSGLNTRLTFGRRNVKASGISDDGTKLLVNAGDIKVDQRPSTLTSLYLIDIPTGECKTILENEGFFGDAALSPDGRSIAMVVSPEGLGGVGNVCPEGMTPSMYDNQLLVMDVESGKITPLTRDFNPSVEEVVWSSFDGNIYFTAENRDRKSLYRVNPKTGRIDDLNAQEEYVVVFTLASDSPALVYTGWGASNSDRIHSLNLKNGRHNLVEDINNERMKGIRIGECKDWNFLSSRGDSIYARYILPPDFDPTKKYPMIVNYYGGCSPTSRLFESRYPHHVYAANGYVVLVINPRGATGFGQEYSAHHVNTAGEGVADDIIDGVKTFVSTHPWVDEKKIGCIGASYGGFMTQYLQTKTDLFAAAISHAGISDHTSYWGEGYWGYSYSEVCMADSYPWTRKDLFVDRSPLYNVDKIHTPLLFLHGDADMNVPFGESVQMYTALKRLGRETAFVAVKGAGHHVSDFNQRKLWQETIFAWFAKHLQDDPSWWETMYPTKAL